MNSKYKIQSVASAIIAFALFASCADKWDEHYSSETVGNGGTLWEAVSANSDLSNFARVVEGCEYNRILSGNQTYTVFAPSNSAFTAQQADSLIAEYEAQKDADIRTSDNTVVKQFLQNHISLYKHPVSGLTNDTITMMNGKYQPLTSSTVGDGRITSSNELCSNGVLFTVDEPIEYFPNVLEYLGQDSELDSVYAFLSSHNVYEFQADKSVPGDIVDGQTVYLDSVSELRNDLLTKIGEINSEDSTYWMLAPVNSEWSSRVAEYESYFNYDNTVNRRDSMQYTQARMALIGGNVFSRTANPDAAFRDSAVSTVASSYFMRKYLNLDPYYIYYKPFEPGGVFDGAEDITCSNGHVLKTRDYRMDKFATFMQTVRVEAELISYQDTLVDAEEPLTIREVREGNPFYGKVSGNSYVDVVPKSPDLNPIVTFTAPDVLSNVGYDIYVVFAPVLATDTLASAESRLPNSFRVFINYNDQNGKPQSRRIATRFYTTPDVVDSVLVATDFEFPTASVGLSDAPTSVRIQSVVNASETSKYSRTMHIDCILLIPHEKNAAAQAKRRKK